MSPMQKTGLTNSFLVWFGKGITMKVITWGSQQSVSCVLSVFGKVTNRVTIVQAYS